MATFPETREQLSNTDREELTKLVNAVALSENSLIIYAIAPESAPDHPAVAELKTELDRLEEPLQFINFFYSDNSLFNFLAILDDYLPKASGRRVVLAFGLEQLPKPRLKQELEQLNLAREKIFEQDLVLVFWLSRESFLGQFRDRAPDFWDWRGKVILFETRHPLLYAYLEWLIAENSYLTINGVMQVNRQVDIFLDQIYVSLQAERRQIITTTEHQQTMVDEAISQSQASPNDQEYRMQDLDFPSEYVPKMNRTATETDASTTNAVTERVDLADVVRGSCTCNVILGAPGAGKTTLLKYLTLHFAKALRDNLKAVHGETETATLGQPRWPIYFKVADYAERLERHPNLDFLDYLEQFYKHWEDYFDDNDASALSNRLLEQMDMGNCLILLDGLDEVFDQKSRQQIVEQINKFAKEFGHNKLVVTSRIAGYQEVKLASRFTEYTIADMSSEQISDFLHRWCWAVEQAQKPDATPEQQSIEGDQQAEKILSDIQKNEGVKRLTANPLLLTILALIHRNGERLPERRVKLYELAVQTLTADWQLSKNLPNMQKVLLPEGEVIALLAPLAYWMHEEKPSGLITHDEVVQQLTPRLAEFRNEAPDSPEILQAVEEFLRRVRETTGLFVERAPNVYGFMHLTFEEYFAARHIIDNDISKIKNIIESNLKNPRWDEPAVLALSLLETSRPNQFKQLIDELFELIFSLCKMTGEKWFVSFMRIQEKNVIIQLSLLPITLLGLIISSSQKGQGGSVIFRRIDLCFKVLAEISIPSDIRYKLFNSLLIISCYLYHLKKWKLPELRASLRRYAPSCIINKIYRAFKTLDSFGETLSQITNEIKDYILLNCEVEGNNIAKESLDYLYLMATSISLPQQVVFNSRSFFIDIVIQDELREPNSKYIQKLFSKLISVLSNNELAIFYCQRAASYVLVKEHQRAISDFKKSCSLYKDTGLYKKAAYQWFNVSECYRKLDEYNSAIEAVQKYLLSSEKLTDQFGVAHACWQLGIIYTDFEDYRKAVSQFESSRELWSKLKNYREFANLCYSLANCYREWGKYEQALLAEQQDLDTRQKLYDQVNTAYAYRQMGRIYQDWDKYEEAISFYEKSRDLHQQLSRDSDVAGLWAWISDCYREWGKYEQALLAEQQDLDIRQKLGEQVNTAYAYRQMGRIYQNFGKYEETISFYEKSRDLHQQLNRDSDVAGLWAWTANCYREWGKYEQALLAEQQDLDIRQKLGEQVNTAYAYRQMGRIYQDWNKYEEAISFYEKSRDLHQQLNRDSDVSGLWIWIGDCYRKLGKYSVAIKHFKDCVERYKFLEHPKNLTLSLRKLANTQRLKAESSSCYEHHQLLQQASINLQEAAQVATQEEYRKEIAFNQFSSALLIAEQLRWLPLEDCSIPKLVTQFEQTATDAFDCLAELGQVVDGAYQALNVARAYLEIKPLKNLEKATALSQQSLQTFQIYNRRKLQAAANKLLGEICLARAYEQESSTDAKASNFFHTSLHIYCELGITGEVSELERLLSDCTSLN